VYKLQWTFNEVERTEDRWTLPPLQYPISVVNIFHGHYGTFFVRLRGQAISQSRTRNFTGPSHVVLIGKRRRPNFVFISPGIRHEPKVCPFTGYALIFCQRGLIINLFAVALRYLTLVPILPWSLGIHMVRACKINAANNRPHPILIATTQGGLATNFSFQHYLCPLTLLDAHDYYINGAGSELLICSLSGKPDMPRHEPRHPASLDSLADHHTIK